MNRPIRLATQLADEGLDERRHYRGAVLAAAVLAVVSLGLFRTAPAFAADAPTTLRQLDQHMKKIESDADQDGTPTWGEGTRWGDGNDHTAVTNGGGKTTMNGNHTGQDQTAVTNGGSKTTMNGNHTGQDHSNLTNGGSKTTMNGNHTYDQGDGDGGGWDSDTWNGGEWND